MMHNFNFAIDLNKEASDAADAQFCIMCMISAVEELIQNEAGYEWHHMMMHDFNNAK